MLNRIIRFSIQNKLIIGLFVLALIGYGSYQLSRLPIDAVPDITDNQVQVITIAPALGATDIERLITFVVEQANSNIAGIKEIRSFSRFGLSLVTIVFDEETDVYWARQQVAERLQQIQNQIPPGVGTPELGPVTTGLGEIYQYVVRAKEGYELQYDETELRTIQDWIVRRQLLGVKGVAEVSSFGGKLKQYEIAINPAKLKSHQITLTDVFTSLENNNQNTGGAYIEKNATVLYIRSEGLIADLEDIKNISIKNSAGGVPLFIKDVAQIQMGYATRYGAMCYNDKGEVAGAVVMMLKGANSNEVIKNVKERIALIGQSLPEGVVIEPFLDRTKMVNHAIGTVQTNLMEGALIVVFVLVVFLGNLRAGLLVASVIPLSMLFAVIMMNTFGVSGNLMSLGALDFGLIVDGAVIIVEAVMHRLSHSKTFSSVSRISQQEMDAEVNLSASRMMNSAVFGQLIILIVYLPIFTLEGIEGKMFKPMAQTVAFALLGAFLLSLTYIPMMSALFLSKTIKQKKNLSDRWMEKIERVYGAALTKVLSYPKTVLIAALGLFLLAMLTFSTLGGEFMPALEEGDFAVDTRVLVGSHLNTTIAATQKAAHLLLTKFPEVEKVVTKIGSGEVPTDPMPMEASDMMVILKDKAEWSSASTFDELAEKMSHVLEDVPGITTGFQYPVQMRFNELMTGARQDVVCKIFGEDLDTLARYAAKLGTIVNTVEGAQDLYVETVTGMPQIIIDYNRPAIAQYGLDIATINKMINTAFAGKSSGLVFEGEKRFDLVVRLQSELRKSLADVEQLLIPTPQGTQIPLYQLASVAIRESPNQIQREDARRRIVVGFNVGGRDVESIVGELEQKVAKQIALPVGYSITYGGAFENLQAAKRRLSIAVPVSLFLILLLLYFAFHSLKQGLLIYTAIPLSAIGGIFFLALRGMPFSISAGIGFIALFGVAVLNGIVLIAEFNRIKKEGETDLKQIVLLGTNLRLRPVLMTACVASLGFLPMAVSNGAGAEVQRPLATVVIGGLLVATFLTLFVLPVLYILFEKGISWKKIKVAAGMLCIALLFVFPGTELKAQAPITYQEAVAEALKNNLSVKNEKLQVSQRQQLIKTAYNLPQTNLALEYGQINSIYNDTRFSIGQSIQFPAVYTTQKSLLKREWETSVVYAQVQEAGLKKQVAQVFYDLIYLKEKQKLLEENDSIFRQFLSKAELRFRTGESNSLERMTAQNQSGQIVLQLTALEQDLQSLQVQFQVLLNSPNIRMPVADGLKMDFIPARDSLQVRQHVSLRFLEGQKQVSLLNTKAEKAKLLPSFLLGYNNMSMAGSGADGKFYQTSTRFQSIQAGVGIPLFFGWQKAKIQASRTTELIAENEYALGMQVLQAEYERAWLAYDKQLQAVAYYENTALTNASAMLLASNAQFTTGNINYLEWVLLMNNVITIRSEYLDAVKNLNEALIELNYLTTQ